MLPQAPPSRWNGFGSTAIFDVSAKCRALYAREMQHLGHPNEPGKWTRLDTTEAAALWQRDRSDPFPVTMFYVVALPRQTEVLYDELNARARFSSVTSGDKDQAA